MQSCFVHAGPAVSVDTACSSALVAMHLGSQHLASHGGAMLACGVNLMLSPSTTAYAQVGSCSTFHSCPWTLT
jgi:acyl transferase domain-containing protein